MNVLQGRRQEESIRILADQAAESDLINIGNDLNVNKILKEQLFQKNQLQIRRNNRLKIVKSINEEYIKATQEVLNDKTLDFLIANSMIDAPTLTSIFAGFELARASEEDEFDDDRKLRIDSLNEQDKIDVDQFEAGATLSKQELDEIEQVRDRALDQEDNEADALRQAVTGDINNLERSIEAQRGRAFTREIRQEDNDRRLEIANINAANRGRTRVKDADNDLNRIFSSLRSTTPITTTPANLTTQPDALPITTSPVDTTPADAITPRTLSDNEVGILNELIRDDTPTTDIPAFIAPGSNEDLLTDQQRSLLEAAEGIIDQPNRQLNENELGFLNNSTVRDNPNDGVPLTLIEGTNTDELSYKQLIELSAFNAPEPEISLPEVIEDEPVVTSIANEDSVFNEDVLAEIASRNIDLVELQQQVEEVGIDPSTLTMEEFNDLFDGEQQ